MPVSRSGVMFGETIEPNGVSIGAAAGEFLVAAGQRVAAGAVAPR